jgi:hypothetical protein
MSPLEPAQDLAENFVVFKNQYTIQAGDNKVEFTEIS